MNMMNRRVLLAVSITLLTAPFGRAEGPAARDKFHLYLLIGQSNMAGRGKVEEQDRTPHPRVFMFTKAQAWAPAGEPLHFDKPKAAGVGPGFAFAKAMAEADPSATVGLIPCAVGGSPLDSWKPGALDAATKTHPYDDALARVKAAMKDGTLKGILWHQGESDSSEKLAPTYGARLEQLMGRLRDELGDEVPIVVGQLAPFKTRDNAWAQKVNEELTYFPFRLANCAVASSEGFVHKGDNVHFDAPSAREFGRRYAEQMKRLQALPAPAEFKVWPLGLPDGAPLAKPEEKKIARVRSVSEPTLRVYLPAKEKATGAAVVICPGGGYGALAIEKEGYNVARWLNTLGVAGFVLKYRLKDYAQPSPLLDAQQAIRIVRERAGEWGVDPKRVGVIGFSAGGHLAAAASTSAALPIPGEKYRRFDAIDCRPDFSVLVYGVLPQTGSTWAKDMYTALEVTQKAPPAFLAHAKDDKIPCQLSADYAAKLQGLNIPVELYLYETGGHGYGLGQSGGEASLWPSRCAKWMEERGLLKGARQVR